MSGASCGRDGKAPSGSCRVSLGEGRGFSYGLGSAGDEEGEGAQGDGGSGGDGLVGGGDAGDQEGLVLQEGAPGVDYTPILALFCPFYKTLIIKRLREVLGGKLAKESGFWPYFTLFRFPPMRQAQLKLPVRHFEAWFSILYEEL